MDELFAYLENLYPLSDVLKAALVGRIQKETYRKNRPLLSTGHFCDWIAFIETGLVKICYDIPGGDERIISFSKSREIACAIKSFTSNTISKVAIVSLDDTVIRKIRKIELETICERFPEFNIHLRKIMASQGVLIEDHYLLLALAPKKRVEKIREDNHWMLQDKRIKGYMVANYLGIEPGNYSRWMKG